MIYQCYVCMLTCYKLRGALLASCFLFFWGWWYFWTRPLHPRPRLLRSPFTVKPLPHSLPLPSVKVNLCDSVCLDGDCGLSGMLSLYGWCVKNSTNDHVKEKETKKRNKKKISKDFKELKHWENAEWKLFLCFFGFCQKLVRKRAIQHESSAKALHKTRWHIQGDLWRALHEKYTFFVLFYQEQREIRNKRNSRKASGFQREGFTAFAGCKFEKLRKEKRIFNTKPLILISDQSFTELVQIVHLKATAVFLRWLKTTLLKEKNRCSRQVVSKCVF